MAMKNTNTKTNTKTQEVSRRISTVLNTFVFHHLFLKGLYTNQFKLPCVNVYDGDVKTVHLKTNTNTRATTIKCLRYTISAIFLSALGVPAV